MELHSYAKRRILKKWTIEQKRKLVEARIAQDAWFTNKPSSVMPWRKVLIVANLDDFNVFFVRKQWSMMLARYKVYKRTRLGSNIASKAIENELIKRINQEWEFFEPIHTYMTRKTTNLHSYALTHRSDNNSEQQEREEVPKTSSIMGHHQTNNTPTKLLTNETITINISKDCIKENIPNNTTIVIKSNNISEDDGIHLFSSDTSNEFQAIAETTRIINGSKEHQSGEGEEHEHMGCVRNTDHDFYSKRSSLGDMASAIKCHEENELHEQQSNYFADDSEESQGSLNMEVDLQQTINTTNAVTSSHGKTTNNNKIASTQIKSKNKTYCEIACSDIKEEMLDSEFLNDMPSTSKQNRTNPQLSSKPRRSERDKYYRHKRRWNRRLEKRFDAIVLLMAQVVKNQYPNVDVTPLEDVISSLASIKSKVLSESEDDDSLSSDDSNTSIPTTTHDANKMGTTYIYK